MTYNTRSPAVKRLMKEAQELSDATELFYAKPLDDNLFEWHFTIRGPSDTDYDGGIYHGRILLPAEYPMKPPNILLMTPSGRFEINRKICLSISGYHPETWRPSWSIRTALLAIIGFMPTHGVGAIGSLDYPPEERRKLARSSVDFVCPHCGPVKDVLQSLTEASNDDAKEARTLAEQISFTGDKGSAEPPAVVDENHSALPPNCSVPITQHQEQPTVPLRPTVPVPQPLSFDEWYKIHRLNTKPAEESSEDVPITNGQAHEQQQPATSPIQQHREPYDNRVRSSPTSTQLTRSELVSLQQRQGVLLRCIVVVAMLVGLLLAGRLNGLTADIEN